MTDTMTPEQRHRCMSHIKGAGTKPELLVRRWLWGHGYRYRLNVKSVPGKPDIVLRNYRTAIFVNGCFWHGHGVAKPPIKSYELRDKSDVESSRLKVQSLSESRSGNNLQDLQDLASTKCEQENIEKDLLSSKCCKIPSSNREFWVDKIRRNQERDERNYRLLQENGWQVIVVWECQLKGDRLERTMCEVELLLNNNLLTMYKHRPIPYPTEDDDSLPMAAES